MIKRTGYRKNLFFIKAFHRWVSKSPNSLHKLNLTATNGILENQKFLYTYPIVFTVANDHATRRLYCHYSFFLMVLFLYLIFLSVKGLS